MAGAAEFFAQQETALIVRVPEAEPVIGELRARFDVSAAVGVPAHVTVLFPWMPNLRIDQDTLTELGALFRGFEAFSAEFVAIEDRDEVIWMRPEPEQPFRDLTTAVSSTWPDFPPYEGKYDEVIPHLTIAEGDTDQTPGSLEAEIRPGLPIRTRVSEVELLAFDGRRWSTRQAFPLGG